MLFTFDKNAARRYVEFFTANIRNRNTRCTYARAVQEFALWCESNGLPDLRDIEPAHVAYIEGLHDRFEAAFDQAAAGRHSHPVQLARRRPGLRRQSGECRPRAEIFSLEKQDVGAAANGEGTEELNRLRRVLAVVMTVNATLPISLVTNIRSRNRVSWVAMNSP
jgi:hypothetical protein